MDLTATPFSFLDLAPVREGEDFGDALKNSLQTARECEKLGFKRFWIAEHHNIEGIASSATSVLIGFVAGGTQRIRVGSGGIMLPNHTPLRVAEDFGTLSKLYGDRIDLGVGRANGSDYQTAMAVRKERIGSDENFFEELGELLDFLNEGRHGGVRALPAEGSNVPLWLLGSSTYSASVAAQKGLPYVFASHFAPRFLFEALRIYRENFTPSETLQKPYVIVALPCVVADDDDEAVFFATSAYLRGLALVRRKSLKLQKPVPFLQIDWNENEKAFVLSSLSMMVLGSKERVGKQLAIMLEETRADEFIFTCDVFDQSKRLRSLELLSEVMRG